jgi:DNA-binding MarR family transcriptional regulator
MRDDSEDQIGGGAAEGLELDRFLPYRLAVLAHGVSRALSEIYRERFQLTIPEWRVIANLGRHAPTSANRLAERGSMDKTKVSRAVARLVESGLVTRESDPHDNRLLVLRLSEKGAQVYREIAPLALAWESQFLETLDAEERAVLNRALDKLQARADALREGE